MKTFEFGTKLMHKETKEVFLALDFEDDEDYVAVVNGFGEVFSVKASELNVIKPLYTKKKD